jgi:hypothetical protein
VKKNRGQSGFGDYKCRTQKKTKDYIVCQIMKYENTVGPTLRGFGVRNFMISNAKHQHTTTLELRKCEWNVGPTLWGFRVQDFAISNAEHQHTTTPELRKCEWNVGPTLQVSGFKIL